MFFSVVVRLEAPDKRFILWTPGWIVTPVNYFQIEEVLSLTVSDSVLRIRVYLTKNKTEKSLNGKKRLQKFGFKRAVGSKNSARKIKNSVLNGS